MADGTFRRSDTSKDGRGAGNKGGWIPQRHVVAHICRKGTWILYAGGGEPWGYSAGCKLMVSPWHDGGWARPKGSAWSMDGVCAGSNGSCHDTRRSLAKIVSPSFPRSGRKSIPSPSSSCPREMYVCEFYRAEFADVSPFLLVHFTRYLFPSSILEGARKRDRSNRRAFEMQNPSLFHYLCGDENGNFEMPDT